MADKRARFDGISTLRFVAACGIMISHVGFGHYYFRFFSPAMGAHLFLCISAFLFMYTTREKTAGVFLKNRLIRVFPLYAILTVLTFLVSGFFDGLAQGEIGIKEMIKSLLFIPYSRGSMKSGDVVRPIVGPAWTMYYDVWFAVMFACSMKISRKWRGLISSCMGIAAYGVGAILPKEYAAAVYLHRVFWFDFVAGVLVYYVWKYLVERKYKIPAGILKLVATLAIFAMYFGPSDRILQPIETFFILSATLLLADKVPAGRFTNWFSKLSYSFYLIHYYVIIIVGKIVDLTVFSADVVWASAAVFVISLLLSVCSYLVIEKWFGDLLKHLLERKQVSENYA